MAQIQAAYPDDVRFVYRHFPLASIHDKALLATQAAEAAGLQGKFWEMHDFLFANYNAWVELPVGDFPGWVLENTTDLGLDMDQFAADLTSETMAATHHTHSKPPMNGVATSPMTVLTTSARLLFILMLNFGFALDSLAIWNTRLKGINFNTKFCLQLLADNLGLGRTLRKQNGLPQSRINDEFEGIIFIVQFMK